MTIFDLTIDGRSYDEMSNAEQAAWHACSSPFTQQEVAWFAGHYLRTDAITAVAINQALNPGGNQVVIRTDGTHRYIMSDVLTDCGVGQTFRLAGETLKTLPVVEWTYVPPPPDDEEEENE